MSKILIVGQAPGRRGDPDHPLEGRTGAKLADLLGLTEREYMRETRRENLLRRWPGKNGKGDAFPARAAVRSAKKIRRNWHEHERVIFLGRNVARAFGFGDLEFLTWAYWRPQVAVLPHPSGIVTWWNERRNRAAARRFMRTAMLPRS